MPAVRDFKIGKVAATQSSSGFFHGFSIRTAYGAPLISIHYGTEAEAEAARQAVEDALGNAVEVVTPD
jgi:hypothetical protein